jgi:ribosomal protein L35
MISRVLSASTVSSLRMASRSVSFASMRCNAVLPASPLFSAKPSFSSGLISRGFKNIANPHTTKTLKTKKAVLKRMRLTGDGGMKCKHSGKSHLCRNKGRTRVRRLAETKTVKGRYLAKMKTLLMHGK